MNADLIVRNGRFTTLPLSNPTATAVAIADGVFTAVDLRSLWGALGCTCWAV
jgi:predicted amidohydrolase YtcJ